MKRIHLYLSAIVNIAILCNIIACKEIPPYQASVDIPSAWVSTDTLYLPLEASDQPAGQGPVSQRPYHLTLGARHRSDFLYQELKLIMELQYIDSQGKTFLITRQPLRLSLTDEKGRWDGGTWGSLIQRENPVASTLTFPYSGSYRLALAPDYGTEATSGLISVTLTLHP